MASLEHIIAFEFGDSITIEYGPGKSKVHSENSRLRIADLSVWVRLLRRPRHFAFGIFLRPLGSWQLFRIPLATLADENFDGGDQLGHGIHTLRLRLEESKT